MTTRVERTDTPHPAGFVRGAIDHGEARRRVLESRNVPACERVRRSDEKADKKAAKAEKKAQKKEKQKADLADSAQFKGFDKVVVAELARLQRRYAVGAPSDRDALAALRRRRREKIRVRSTV